ncbi:DUF72 domain-containing protein [Phreatobacter sp. AB_2022a]|uniref:DUF72 domain-containing protein n=1 Tax=Phreatobacter sp. AB_2022a TaxID=3003134 RepID=UPI00228735AB|nr:DUF72 domain-containing protein [Phreatobacter sp. AB_2022a]MCZ0732792.1 DUF72 domain-containing protein [Phreatobacter sp. AB_2022a]
MSGKSKSKVRVGIGGWTFEPWRETFYPPGLAQKRELEYAASKVTSIEINGTYYGSQKPESFARWREETPDGFIFALKGSRFTTNRRVLAEAGPSVEKFLTSGVTELKEKLGPINWQFMATKKFDPADFEAFLKLLPKTVDGHTIRHAVEVRHDSFKTPDFIALARDYGVCVIYADSPDYTSIADVTAPFVYARLQCASETEELGYSKTALDAWAKRAGVWAAGGAPEDLALVAKLEAKSPAAREVFVYMINGFKPKAPAAAMALIERLK